MSESMTFPGDGITHLVIAETARDATVRGLPGAVEIEVTYQSSRTPPTLTVEGSTARLSDGSIIRASVPAGTSVTVQQAPGDLRIHGLEADVSLETVRGDLRLTDLAGIVRIATVDGDVRAENTADLRLMGSCRGDLRFENGGSLAVEAASGDLRLAAAGEVRLGRVHGDLWVEKIQGALQCSRADGDVRLSEVSGPVVLGHLAGDLRAGGLPGGLIASQVGGDVVLHGPFGDAAEYTLVADGDVGLHLPADADVRLAVKAGGRIRSDPKLTPAADGSPSFSATLGHGAARVAVTCSGDLRIVQAGAETRAGTSADPVSDIGERIRTDLGERIRQQVTASLAAAGISINTGDFGWGRGRGAPGGVHGAKHMPPPTTPPPARSAAPGRPAMSEEQLAVLKMLEEGKITAEEGETLLKALGL